MDVGGPVGVYQIFGWSGKDMGGIYNKPKDMPAPPHWLPSALIAPLLGEPHAPRLAAAVQAAPARYVSVASVLETSLVMQARIGERGDLEVDALVRDLELELAPVDPDQLRLARDAAARVGKGRHPAALDYGDLFSYGLAASLDEPLLCTGQAFAQTDVALVTY